MGLVNKFCKVALSHAGKMAGVPSASNGMPVKMMMNAINEAGPNLGEKLAHIASRTVKRVIAPVVRAMAPTPKTSGPKGMGR